MALLLRSPRRPAMDAELEAPADPASKALLPLPSLNSSSEPRGRSAPDSISAPTSPRSTPSSPPRRPSPASSLPLSRPPLALHGRGILPCLLAMPSLLTLMDAPAACCSTCPIEILGLCSCPFTAVVCLLKQCRSPRLRDHHVWPEPHQVVASCSCDVL